MNKQVYNPFLPDDVYIPDGEPHVFGNRIYLFGSHDMEGGESFCMLDYEGWSAPIDDLSAWESAGTIYSAKQDPLYSEERPYMYAPDVVKGNDGRFYLYYCLAGWKGNGGYDGPISVAVSDEPNGKYEYWGFVKNIDGTPFNECVVFDPALINDNGTIRLYIGTSLPWGWNISALNRPLTAGIASGMYHRPKSEFKPNSNPLGAYMVELEEDMLTVRGQAKNILSNKSLISSFKGHAFFEGASIRKIEDTYYFIFSSQKNHELCYATSKYPDRDFVYGGTIISTGDVGIDGRKEKDRLNVTGTTHGSIECIDGQWYVFYHRLSHGTDYSRQACAEPITIEKDGTIKQVEVSSCGLNGGPLEINGSIPATKACIITNGHMPHISNQKCKKAIPMVTHNDKEHFVTNIENDTIIGFKKLNYRSSKVSINLVYRGSGNGKIYFYHDIEEEPIGMMEYSDALEWNVVGTELTVKIGIESLYLVFKGTGKLEVLDLRFIKENACIT